MTSNYLKCVSFFTVVSGLIVIFLYSTANWTHKNERQNGIASHVNLTVKEIGLNGNWTENRNSLNGADLNLRLKNRNHHQLSKLTKEIQRNIYKLQHPTDCKKVKKMQCLTDDRTCAFGCQIHQISYCLLVAYAKRRVLMPILDKWRYSEKGWNEHFLPLTNCTINDINETDPDDVINIPFYNYATPELPPAIPTEYAERLITFHRDPPLFWIGQFMMYIMRYTEKMQKYIENKKEDFNFADGPVVGIHVRRGDKVYPPGGYPAESDIFEVKEYMKHVSVWFDMNLSKKDGTKRLYLATDDPKIINETISAYPDYEILSDYEAAVEANINKYRASSLMDMVTSLHLLSSCDFVVCTFSSNVCRFVYELMQPLRNGDFTNSVISLDTIYYYYGQYIRQQIAIIEHKPDNSSKGEIELKVGDILDVNIPNLSTRDRNKFDSNRYMEGKNLRTSASGKYLKYKAVDKWKIVDFPNYS